MNSLSEALSAAIRTYLATHPDAADSPQGIRQWWLPSSLSHAPPLVVRQTLERMVQRGELRSLRLPDGEALYAAAETPPAPDASGTT